ncbi:MAG: cobyric acid synthase CobQ [Deltaproteobacteria bacterium GWC2_42_11]|nr:MAG: cobyric acid synthase CobQ [Deltaproteobacteria bacterium GWC2_42_11]
MYFKAKPIMFQGTSSHVGKSIITAALCRILKTNGLKVAPFKAQNMALNSFVTKDGGEMGRAQVFQAEAAGIEPSVDMNPILLKPTSDMWSQVIIHGRVYGNMNAREYHLFKKEAAKYVMERYKRLAEEYDVIVIEGAGSPAEINLRENDIANMGLAEMVDAPVVLVGDIDRGGVFASLVGTMDLLTPSERHRVRGFIINKFRGDMGLLKPGLDFLENRTKLPVLGVVPYIKDIILPDEDGVSLERSQESGVRSQKKIKIAVIKLPRISNFTDFDPFKIEPDVDVGYAAGSNELEGADIIIIPGSKNTIDDLKYLWERGFAERIIDCAENGKRVIGICGGFQMLGRFVKDPSCTESNLKECKGLELLDIETVLEKEKNTFQVEAKIQSGVRSQELRVKGYEIHMGETSDNCQPFSIITSRNDSPVKIQDGAVSDNGKVWGTYIHGIFDNDEFRTDFLNEIRSKKGLPLQKKISFRDKKDENIKTLADVVRNNIDIKKIYDIAGLAKRC